MMCAHSARHDGCAHIPHTVDARERHMIIHTARSIVDVVGLGDYDLVRALPPGTKQFDCVQAPSGHLMPPCAEFQQQPTNTQRGRLQLTPQLALPVETVTSAPDNTVVVRPLRTRGQAMAAPLRQKQPRSMRGTPAGRGRTAAGPGTGPMSGPTTTSM